MKKVLFGTTALMAAAAYTSVAMAEPISLKVGGKQEAWFGVADVSGDNNDSWGGTGMATDTEVYFQGKTTLDNGLTVKAVIQLEADASDKENADETYMVLSGDFGALQLGARQGAMGNMTWHGAEFTGQDWDEAYLSGNWSPAPDDFAMADLTLGGHTYSSQDDASIAYTSPEFFGFSVGATYTPETGSATGLSDYDDVSNRKDQFEAVVAYDHDFSGVGVHGDFGYLHGYGTSDAPSLEMYRVGGALSYAGFSIGGAWSDNNYAGDATAAGDGHVWQVGAGYENGPYAVDFNYAHATAEGDLITGTTTAEIVSQTAAGVGDDEQVDYYKVAGKYDLGPGIALSAGVYHINYDNDGGEDRAITGGIMGVALKF